MKPASATVNTGELREGSASVAGVVGVSLLDAPVASVSEGATGRGGGGGGGGEERPGPDIPMGM